MKKKAIIFDMDGVLVDSENAYLNLFRDFFSKAPERDQRRHSTENRRRRYPYDLELHVHALGASGSTRIYSPVIPQ